MKKNAGQTFVEVIVIVSIVVIVITALVSGSIVSLKITGYNSLKSQATKYAQEGLELSRKDRDTSWNTFFGKSQSNPAPATWCIDKAGVWTAQTPCPVNIDGVFTRYLTLSYDAGNERIDTTVYVTWKDGQATRTSKIETFFTRWR